MTTMSVSRHGRFGILADWWQALRGQFARRDELHECGREAENIARDLGLSTAELYTIAAKRPDAADPLKLRLAALQLDRAAVLDTDPLVMRDLERVCTLCGSKHRCERDLARHADDPAWRSYCPNAHTLEALKQS